MRKFIFFLIICCKFLTTASQSSTTLPPSYIFAKTAEKSPPNSGNGDKVTEVTNLFACYESKCEKVSEFKLQPRNTYKCGTFTLEIIYEVEFRFQNNTVLKKEATGFMRMERGEILRVAESSNTICLQFIK